MAKKACVGGRARPCACALLVLTLLPAPGMQALREPPALARSCAGFAALPRLPLPCLRDAIRPSRAGLARLRASSLRVNGSRQGSGGGVGGGGIGGVRQGSGPSGMAAALPMPATKVLPSGSLREQREKLNQMHVERQAWYDLMRRRVRASSYQDGALDVRRLFSQFDTNKSGSLDLAEYRALLMRVGLRPFFITDEDLRVLFYEMGATGRGLEVRAREFFAWFSGSGQASVVGPVAQEQGTWKASVAASAPGSARAWKSPEVVRGGEATSTRAADGWSYGESVWWDEGPETRVLKSIVQADAQLVPESAAAGPGKPRVRTAPAVTAEQSAVLSVASQLLDTRAETDHLQPLLAMVEPWTQTTRDKLLSSLHFLVTELGLPASKVKALALENPGVFGLDVDYQMRPRIDALRVGIPQERLGACLARHPRVLDLSFETMSSVVDFLVVEGGIPRAKVSKIVEVMPSLLSHSVDRNLRPKISFLVEDVGIAPEGLAAVLLKFPQVLGLSVEGNLRPTVRYLTDELGVMHSDLSRILTSMPQLLGLSVQGNLQVKVKYLVSELGIPKDRIRDIVVMSPALLSLSVEKNLLPKVQFLVEEAGFSVQEIIKAPNILAYSLDRMRSRHEFLTKKGLKLGLASMVSYSNTEFQRRFDHDGDLL